MKNYKIAVTKDQKKYTVIIAAENEKIAREKVHKEGYSILNIEENFERSITGNKFIFIGEYNGKTKSGKIVGNDIFKIYIKLRNDLGYKINFLYHEEEENISNEEKTKIIKDLEGEYKIFMGYKNKTEGLQEKKEIKSKNNERTGINSFYLKKKLDETYKLIDFVLAKIVNLIQNKELSNINSENKEKLINIYNAILKIKNTTNISKLKEVGELALIKIGELELIELEISKSKKSKNLLNETNKLLKEIGSQKSFIEKDKDIKYIYSKILKKVIFFFQNFKKKEQKVKTTIDKESHSYIKMELHLKKYKEKLNKNFVEIFKNILSSKKKEELLLKRKIIKQNIALFRAKKHGIGFSYTTLKKGYITIIDELSKFTNKLRIYIFYIIFFYVAIFIIYFSFSYYYIDLLLFNYKGLLYFIILLFIYFILYFRVSLFNLILSFVFLSFFIIFSVINF